MILDYRLCDHAFSEIHMDHATICVRCPRQTHWTSIAWFQTGYSLPLTVRLFLPFHPSNSPKSL